MHSLCYVLSFYMLESDTKWIHGCFTCSVEHFSFYKPATYSHRSMVVVCTRKPMSRTSKVFVEVSNLCFDNSCKIFWAAKLWEVYKSATNASLVYFVFWYIIMYLSTTITMNEPLSFLCQHFILYFHFKFGIYNKCNSALVFICT